MPSSNLSRTTSSAGTSNQKFTMSLWIKKSSTDSAVRRLIELYNSSSYYVSLRFRDDDSSKLDFYSESNGSARNLRTNRLFRDSSAWYHIVLAVDTTLATADDRMKIYVNGVQETSFSARTNPSLNENLNFNNSGNGQYVGRAVGTETDRMFDGIMAHVHFIDGTAYDADDFGQTESSSGIWKPKSSPSVTYGTNGFFLKFQDSSALGDDSSGNTNDFTMSGTGTQTLDTPSNVFATMNPLINSGISYENGNLSVAGGADNNFGWGTLAGRMDSSSAGWYFEMKVDSGGTIGSGGRGMRMGIGSFDFAMSDGLGTDGGWSLSSDTGKLIQNTSGTYYLADNGGGNTVNLGVSSSVGDIINVAWKDSKIFIGINGTYYAADGGSDGDPANGTNPSHTVSSTYQSDAWIPVIASSLSDGANGCDFNFGNGYFGTTAVVSANSDTAGLGQFEYSVPSGYYALCTKNIAEYG